MDDLLYEEEPTEIYLKYEDVIPYLPPDPPETKNNTGITDYLKSIKEQTQKFYVSRVNILFNRLRAIWPSGTPIDYYIGYEHFASLNEKQFLLKLQEEESIKTITKLVELRKQGIFFPKDNINHPSSLNQANNINECNTSDSDDDNDFGQDRFSHKKKNMKSIWKEREISVFIKLLSKNNHLKTWKAVSHHFKNKSQNDCYILYQKLLNEGQITNKYAPKKEPKNKSESSEKLDISPYKDVKALFFEFNNQKSIVGPQSESNKEKAINSPFYGYEDMITCDMMFLPTISEYGTVLDYDTWLKIIQETQKDPYEALPIQNKRQIIQLTPENFHQYQHQVKNVGDKM